MRTNRLWAIIISFWYFLAYLWLSYTAVVDDSLFDRIVAVVAILTSLPFFVINIRSLWNDLWDDEE